MNRLILASGSPRRKDLLNKAGYSFDIEPSDFEEDMTQDLEPSVLVQELSKGKALDVASHHSCEERVVMGADTIVVCDGKVIGKPKDEEDARRILNSLSGRSHSVFTGVTLVNTKTTDTKSFSVETIITMKELATKQIDAYIATGEPLDKAGAYGIQGGASPFIEAVDGEYTNVVGLPIDTTSRALLTLGITNETK